MLNTEGPKRFARAAAVARSIAAACVDALFPRSAEELALEKLSPDRAAELLPRAPKPPFPDMSAAFAYKDPTVRRLIWSLKYAKSAHAAGIGGHALWRAIEAIDAAAGRTKKTLIVPMPMTARRLRERGFDQTRLLAEAVSACAAEAGAAGRCAVIHNLLSRRTHASRQTLKNRAERLESAGGAFSADVGQAIDPSNGSVVPLDARLVVIDDVITTGSTMRAAIDALKKAGFADVAGLSLAR